MFSLLNILGKLLPPNFRINLGIMAMRESKKTEKEELYKLGDGVSQLLPGILLPVTNSQKD